MAELTTDERAEVARNVRSGVALLNATIPNWRVRINLDELVMSDPCCCVLGQVFRGYICGYIVALDLLQPELSGDDELLTRRAWAVRHGFEAPARKRREHFDALTIIWKEVIHGTYPR